MPTAIIEGFDLYIMDIYYKDVKHAVQLLEYLKRKSNHDNKYVTLAFIEDKVTPLKGKLRVIVYITNKGTYSSYGILNPYQRKKWKTAYALMDKVDTSELDSEPNRAW